MCVSTTINDHTSSVVKDAAIIKIMILRHGPRKLDEIHRNLTGLYLLNDEAKEISETQSYLIQIERRMRYCVVG